MRHAVIALTVLVFSVQAFMPVLAAGLHKCRNSEGKIVYSDAPCPDKTESVYMKQPKTAEAGENAKTEFIDNGPPPNAADLLGLRARVANAIASLTNLKAMMVEHFIANDGWPEDLEVLDIDPATMKSALVDNVKISGSNGRITASLNSGFGANKKIVLTPKKTMGGAQIEWQCESNFTADVLGRGPQKICESRNI